MVYAVPSEQVIGGGTTAPSVGGGKVMRSTYTKPDNSAYTWRHEQNPQTYKYEWHLYDNKGGQVSGQQMQDYLKTHPNSTSTAPGQSEIDATNTEMRNRYLWNFFGRDQDRRIKQNTSREKQLQKMQDQQDAARTGALSNLDAAYADPSRSSMRDQQYQSELDSALAGLGENYKDTRRRAAIDTGRAGLAGGSVDAERRANLASSYEGNAMDATNTALSRRTDAANTDRNQYYDLRRSIMAGDPQSAAQYAAMAGNESAQADRTSRLGDFYDTYRDINMSRANNTSQLYGGLAGSIGDSYTIDQEAKGRGKTGLYSFT